MQPPGRITIGGNNDADNWVRDLDSIEKAIRNALDKGNAQDRAFREKVYRSAFGALQRTLDANPNVTPQIAEHRRRALSSRIEQIESEFVPALEPDAPLMAPSRNAAPEVRAATTARDSHAPDADAREPVMEPSPHASPEREPTLERAASADDFPGIDPLDRERHRPLNEPRRSRRQPGRTDKPKGSWATRLTGLVLFLVLAAAIGYGAWFAVQSGLIGDTGPSSAQQAADDDAGDADSVVTGPAPTGMVEDIADWINVFRPSELAQVSAPDGSAESMEREGEQLVRVRSGTGGVVSFEIGQGILEQIAGRHATFNIVARAEDGADTQISVGCDFGELGNCGRRRFQVGQTRQDFLFELGMPDGQPGGAGRITINTDIEGEDRAVDIYAIRVSIDG